MVKHKTIEETFVLHNDPMQGCGNFSDRCYWESFRKAKSKCSKWSECGMIKEMVLNGGLKLFWPVTISASPTDLQHSTRDNIWIMAKRGNDFMLYVLKGILRKQQFSTI